MKYGGANGCQTDYDTGLVLMGHRYYDTRQGRFISQDKMEEGTNWYAYCRNNPVNAVDPLGLWAQTFTVPGDTPLSQIIQDTVANGGLPGETYNVTQGGKVTNTFTIPDQIGFNHIIPGYSVLGVFLAARHFANTPQAIKSKGGSITYSYPSHYQKLMYVWNNFHTNSGGDPKKDLVGKAKNPLYGAYDNIGNYGFGAMLAGLGLSLKEGEMGAGMLQSYQALTESDGGWQHLLDNTIQNGTVLGGPPYGDDPWSQAMIQKGYDDYSHR